MKGYPLPKILDFLRKISPFDSLGQDELEGLAGQMRIAFVPQGEAILRMGSAPSQFLYIIHAGSARVTLTDENGEEILVDVRGEGDTFGAVSLLQGAQALFNVSADEDMIVFLLPAEAFKGLVEAKPKFKEHFSHSLAHNFKARRLSSQEDYPYCTNLGVSSLDMSLIGRTVADIMVRDVLTCGPEASLAQASKLMAKRRVSSIVVQDGGQNPIGIVTDTDLRIRVLGAGLDPAEPVTRAMSSKLRSISPRDYAYDALLVMIQHNVSHLLAMENDRLEGIISVHDLQRATGNSPIGIIGDIEKCQSVDELVKIHHSIFRVQESLLRQGGPAKKLVGVVAELNDRLTLRLLSLAEEQMESEGLGRPPVPYCWMALGSGGRREQTLTTDQDSALAFAQPPAEEHEAVKRWFLDLAERVVEGLVRCGFPRDKAGMMACMPDWCHDEDEWRSKTRWWIDHPFDRTLLMASMFFDFRGLHGGSEFDQRLRDMVNQEVHQRRGLFLRYLAKNGLYNRPPLGFLGRLVVEKGGERNNKVDLKHKGLLPVVDLARALALELGLHTTNTFDRLEEIGRLGAIPEEMMADLLEAYGFIMLLRISHHLEARAAGQPPDNYVNPETLSSLQRKMLKESFSAINRVQDHVASHYQTDQIKEI